MTLFVRRFVLVVALCVLALSSPAAPRAEHVFIISLDGGKPAAMEQSQMPALKRLVCFHPFRGPGFCGAQVRVGFAPTA